MVIGTSGLIWVKIATDPAPVARRVLGGEYALLVLLLSVALTGLALLAFRSTNAMGVLLAVHLGTVLALFVSLPYGKFIHGILRATSLLKAAVERQGRVVASD
jgi:citrate/tricarballylate utilization protein